MSLYDWRWAESRAADDAPFYGLLFALIRRADTHNLERIRSAWPRHVAEAERRYNSPGGLLDVERCQKTPGCIGIDDHVDECVTP